MATKTAKKKPAVKAKAKKPAATATKKKTVKRGKKKPPDPWPCESGAMIEAGDMCTRLPSERCSTGNEG